MRRRALARSSDFRKTRFLFANFRTDAKAAFYYRITVASGDTDANMRKEAFIFDV
jgi:hypothetical protein